MFPSQANMIVIIPVGLIVRLVLCCVGACEDYRRKKKEERLLNQDNESDSED